MSVDERRVDPESVETLTGRQLKKPVARRVVLAAVFLTVCAGIVFGIGTGTVSSFGWDSIASICPLGALETMVASKTLIPRGLVFVLIVAVIMVVLGKFFCSWVCPIPSIRSFIDTLTGRSPRLTSEIGKKEDGSETVTVKAVESLTRRESKKRKKALSAKEGCSEQGSSGSAVSLSQRSKTCNGCASNARKALDSRHLILGGSLLSAAVFGFPVFCLICPIGLTFASVVAIVQLFGNQTLSWSLLLFPLILILELTVLRKWCLKFCPMGALASLLSLPNRLFRPKVDTAKCLRGKGVDCQICTSVCPEKLDPHTAERMNECSKCRDCAVNCPVEAISFPLLRGGSKG